MSELTPKQEAFCLAYVETGNASAAYRRSYDVAADSKPETVWQSASRLLSDPKVAARVEEMMADAANTAGVNAVRILRELSRIGFADLRHAFDETGALRKPADWSDEFAASVASIEVVTRSIGEGQVEYVHKLKTWDKNSALEKIAKHLGMFVERHEHTGKGGAPLVEYSTTDIAKALLALLSGARAPGEGPAA